MTEISLRTWILRLAAAAIVTPLTACARYERIPDSRTPACRDRPVVARPEALEFRPTASDAVGGLSGRVRERHSGQGVPGAVLLFMGSDSLLLTSDSLGGFDAGSFAPGSYRLRVRRIGYPTVESGIILPLPSGHELVVNLESMNHDGPCSGFAVLVKRKPWWKVW